ncbi:nucleobindin-2-like isoform X2 [Pollicipes pollicipes]|uniref:nucleobindin-2-like isoform X2 n=1 Tax=Pollicipes pollicipes TaxID=41117 RepID=UPI0018850EBA|nr:nucleobindin-2-like isoform X2 [Pollicipes pollicipes]
MENHWLLFACLLALIFGVFAPPPRRESNPKQHSDEEEDINMNSETLGLEYRNYLEEVVKLLEQDSQFKTILDNATETEVKSGQVADRLHVVDPSIRSKLDELKRIELSRLRQKATEAFELSNGLDREAIKEPLHLDHRNPHTFREEDLRRLVRKTSHDLAELDKERRDDFKKYEMEKEFEYKEGLKKMDEEHKKEAQAKHEEHKKKGKEHAKVHHPLSEDQLEEVWEEQDHMDKDSFDPETFFRMHDVDGNEELDPTEVMALFKTELDKLYNGSDYDPREREEEMNEMRESTYAEVDTDQDGLISLKEFLASSQHDDYKHDQGWQGIPDREVYDQQEYDDFSRHRMEEIQQHIEAGLPPGGQGLHPDQQQLPLSQHAPAAGQVQLNLPMQQQQQQQQVAGQQQQQQIPVQQQQIPAQQQQIPAQQQQAPVYQQQVPVQQQQVPVQQQQVPVQQQQVPVQQQQAVPAQQPAPVQQQQAPIQQQPHGQANQIPVQGQH